jgi:hypothetical protein
MVDRPFGTNIKTTMPNEIISMDLIDFGKNNVSIRDYRYVLVIVDHYTSYTWTYLLEDRKDLMKSIDEWYKFIKMQLKDHPVKTILADGEFITNKLVSFCSRNGIKHDTSEPYVSKHNGMCERTNRSIEEMVRCILFDSSFSIDYWCYAVDYAVYIINRLGKARLKWQSPFFKYFGPNVFYRLTHIRKFGSVGWMRRNPKKNSSRDKLLARAIRVRLIGYGDMNPQYASRGTYHVIDDSGKHYYARNCMFNESEVQETNLTIENLKELKLHSNELTQNNLLELDYIDVPQRVNLINSISVCNKISFEHLNPKDVLEPMTFKEAMNGKFSKEWLAATNAEFDSLIERGTWTLVPKNSMPANKKPVKNKWVYKLKLTTTGQIERFKARLVAKGYTQKLNVDYFDKYAPVVDIMTFLYLFAWGIGNNMSILQIDVKTAFLYGTLEEEIYMDQPEGFIKPGDEDKVCLLKQSLYGLKQAPLCWNKKLNEHFTKTMSFQRLSTDICLYRRDGVYVVVYVDDMLVYGKSQEICDNIYNELTTEFSCTNLGFSKGMLGMIISPVEGGVIIHQQKYIDELLDRFDMKDAKSKKQFLKELAS